jgi:hypothetical protein
MIIRRHFLAAALLSLAFGAGAQTNFVTLVPDGAWTWFNDPRALFHQGKLYYGYVRFADGRSALNVIDPLTGVGTNLWTSTLTQADDHDNPGLLVKQDGRMLALYARHGTDQFFSYRYSTSTNPTTAAAWSGEQAIAATGAGVTYANPYQLSAENGLIYNFMRNLNFNPTVIQSTNGGTNWGTPQLLIKTGTGSIRPYVKYASNSTNRIDFLYTDGHPRDLTNSLYHLYYQGGELRKTDGVLVKDFSAIPLLHDNGERGSVIYQYSDAPEPDPNDHIPTGRAWCWEIAYQPNGDPACVFTVQRDMVTGTNWFDDRIYYYYGRWTGTNWQKRFIAQAGRPLYASEDDYAGGICLDPEDPNVIYLSSNAANPFDLSSTTAVPLRANERYEIYKGLTTDGGLSFTWQPVTTNSAADNLRPYIPRNHGPQRTVLWFRGAYSSFTSYACSIVGLFSAPLPQPPSVSITNPAGRPVILTNSNSRLKLSASTTDTGPGPLTLAWSTVNGPTNALFSDLAAAATTAAFPVPGAYLLRLTAADGTLSGSDEITVVAGSTGSDPDPALALWLKLDETSGLTAADSSGAGNPATLSGGATWQPAGGMIGGALQLDGASGMATITDADTLDNSAALTLAFWFRAAAYPGDSGGLVSKRDNISSQNAYTTYLKTPDRRLYVDLDNSNNRFASVATIATGAWYHVAVVFDGALPASQRAALWINGGLDVVAAETSAAIPNYTSNVRIGNTHPGATNWFNGRMDDVRIYRRALVPAEIALLAATNFAPSVSLSPSLATTNFTATHLAGTVSDDGRGGVLSASWSRVSGPGQAAFANPQQAATDVTFNRPGNYVLRLTASDNQVETCADVAVSVAPNPNHYDDWIALAFPGVTNLSVIGMDADPDHDGVPNLAEFALGMTPSVADAGPFGPGRPGLPIGFLLLTGGTSYLAMAVQRPVGRQVLYQPEASGSFSQWSAGLPAGSTPNGDGTETATFRDWLPMNQAVSRLMRLKVLANP